MKYCGHYSLTLVSEQGQIARSERTAEFEVDEFEHPGSRLRRIALDEMEKVSAVGVSIHAFDEIAENPDESSESTKGK